jgi:hypothetical protein
VLALRRVWTAVYGEVVWYRGWSVVKLISRDEICLELSRQMLITGICDGCKEGPRDERD